MFPLILSKLENNLNEFCFYFSNQNGNISPDAVTGGNIKIKLKKKNLKFNMRTQHLIINMFRTSAIAKTLGALALGQRYLRRSAANNWQISTSCLNLVE